MSSSSRENLEHQLGQLQQAFDAGQIDQSTFEQERYRVQRQLQELDASVQAAGSDFFSTGGGAPRTASGVSMRGGEGERLAQAHMIRDRYRVESLVGEGGMGVVYKVHDLLRNRLLALKMLHPNFPQSAQSQLAAELSMQERIRHKGVVRTYDLDRDPSSGRLFYTMEYVDGPSLEDALEQAKREGRVPPMALERVTELLRGLCAVLTVAHQEGIVHRDLKPANILLPRAGGVKLLDFGIAKELTEQAQHTGYTGTPIFMAPEQLRGGGSVTAAADIYSLGVLLYQLLTGQLFYGRMPGPSEWLTDQGMVPAFSTAIDEVVFKALDFSPDRRHQTPQELLQDYERALGLASVVAPATPPPSTGVQSKSWRQAARAARREDASYEEPPPEEPVVSSPERPVPRIRGRAARSAGPDVSYDSGMKVRSRDHGGKRSQKKKKKMPGALKVVLWLLFGLPIGMGLLGALISWFAYKNTSSTIQSQINKQIRSVISDAPTNVGDLKIDLSQVDEAFQKTALSSTASSSSSYSRKHKEWMKSFERRVNEIYTGTEVVSLYVRRISKKSTIYGFLNNNRIYGYQEGSDTLLFKIVQENDISIPYSQILRNRMNLRRKPYNRRPDNRQGGDEFDDGFDRLDGKKTTRRPSVGKTTGTTGSGMPSNHETMRYRIEDGYGWVYKTSTLPKGAPYYEFAINPLPMFYYTSLTRHSLILGNRRTYRSSSLYRTRVTRFNRFRGTVRSRRRTHYRSSKARSRLLRKRLRRLGRRYRSSYRRSGGKW